MTKPIKTELTRDEVRIILEVYNCMDSMVDDTMEMMDVRLSQLSDLRDKTYALKHMFNFRPPVREEDGNPNHYKPYVLPDDPAAWYYEGDS